MKITCLTDQGVGLVNEDSLLVTENLFGVFDGATGLIKYTDTNGATGGLIASQTAKDIFENNSRAPLVSSLGKITTNIRKKMMDAGIPLQDKAALWVTTASVVRLSDELIEYVQISDSPILFLKKDGSLEIIYTEDTDDVESLTLWSQLAKEGVQDIHNDKRMVDQLLKSRRAINVTSGALNGEIEALKFVKRGKLLTRDLQTILLFTDGMLIPNKNPENKRDFQKIVDLYRKGGLPEVKEYIRGLENSDPLGKVYPRFKTHDDLTAIAIEF